MINLSSYELLTSEDPAKRDLELICTRCSALLCDAEHGDTLADLVGMAQDHECSAHLRLTPPGLSWSEP
jgi:hypothetical protein